MNQRDDSMAAPTPANADRSTEQREDDKKAVRALRAVAHYAGKRGVDMDEFYLHFDALTACLGVDMDIDDA